MPSMVRRDKSNISPASEVDNSHSLRHWRMSLARRCGVGGIGTRGFPQKRINECEDTLVGVIRQSAYSLAPPDYVIDGLAVWLSETGTWNGSRRGVAPASVAASGKIRGESGPRQKEGAQAVLWEGADAQAQRFREEKSPLGIIPNSHLGAGFQPRELVPKWRRRSV